MQIKGQAKKTTIYIDESDKWEHKPLFMAILEMLKKEDCAGATVTRAMAGFGAHSRIHTAGLVALSTDLPLIIEWVDSPARVNRVMPRLQQMVVEGLITVQDVEVVSYHHRELRDLPASVPVQDIMSREVHAVSTDTPLLEVIELLIDKIYRALPVVDQEQRVVGIVTEANLLSKVEFLATSARRHLTKAELAVELNRLQRIDQTVAKAMTANPVTVTADTTVAAAVQRMVEHNIKRLPVVSSHGKLLGIVSRVDVLRALGQPPLAELAPDPLPPGRHVQVADIMTANVPTVQADASLAEIIDLLVGNVRRRVIVIDAKRQVVGIITDGDLINRATQTERSGIIHSLSRRVIPGADDVLHLSQRTAAEVMTSPVITIRPQTALSEALQVLLTRHIKRLPVVNSQGQLVGLVGRGGILQALAHSEDFSQLTK
jgi:CBS domain-containing protein